MPGSAIFFAAFAFISSVAVSVQARVTRIEITSRVSLIGGKSFGLAGPYEKVIGKVYFTVDPDNPHNKIIVDLDKAPRNAQGLVEFSADLYILKPKDLNRGNGGALFEIANRGGKGLLRFFNHAETVVHTTLGL